MSELSVVALGGGRGLASTLTAARRYAKKITAIVSVGDDGGSSGRLRADYEIAPPGDVRRCISALAAPDSALGQSLEYRYTNGELQGHPVGNLLLSSLTMALGSFEAAVDEVLKLVNAAGTILPATTIPVTLVANTEDGTVVSEDAIGRSTGIRELWHEPPNPPVANRVIEAIHTANQVIVGPGSLFTSVLAAASLPGVKQALAATTAQRVWVTNVSDGYTAGTSANLERDLQAVQHHGVPIEVIVAQPPPDGSSPAAVLQSPVPVIFWPMTSDDGWTHNTEQLGRCLAEIYTTRLRLGLKTG